jgi:hypothetical protein
LLDNFWTIVGNNFGQIKSKYNYFFNKQLFVYC